MPAPPSLEHRPRTLAQDVVERIAAQIRDGRLAPQAKLPPESRLMEAFGVSRTVVREALSRLQASGLVATRHGIGTFVVGPGEAPPFRLGPQQLQTLRDVIAVLELRIGLETEAAALAAQRRTAAQMAEMRAALQAFAAAVEAGHDAVDADLRLHGEIARATHNAHFSGLLAALGTRLIPRARLEPAGAPRADPVLQRYLRQVNAEHESIVDAIERQDADAARAAMRTHLANSRERRRRAAAAARSPNLPQETAR